jgi:DNA-binding NarL/FixJ family response regulator
MFTPVAAVQTPALVVKGLSSAFEAIGYALESVEDPDAWAQLHPGGGMLVTVRVDDDLSVVSDLVHVTPGAAVIVLLDPLTTARVHRCVGAGARGCVSLDWSDGDVVLVTDAAIRGMVVLPAEFASELLIYERNRYQALMLNSTQATWLRRLASGATVHELAAQVGYSERETYRRLREIYETMGVRSRTEALIVASASGLLDR